MSCDCVGWKEEEFEEEEEEEEEEQPERETERLRDEDGWTYLHLVVWSYVKLKAAGSEELARLLIRAMYRLALAGVDVNARDSRGRTALVLAAAESAHHAQDTTTASVDQSLLTHLLRVGQSTRVGQ